MEILLLLVENLDKGICSILPLYHSSIMIIILIHWIEVQKKLI